MNVDRLALEALVSIVCILGLRRLWYWLFRFANRTANDVFPFLLKIDMEAVYGTFHPEPEQQFRNTLSPAEFTRIQWKRIHLAIHYCDHISNNVQVFLSWTRYERKQGWNTLSPGVRRTVQELRVACLQSRVSVFMIRSRLHLWLLRMALFPFAAPPSFVTLGRLGSWEMISFYEKVAALAEVFSLAYGEEYHEKFMQAL